MALELIPNTTANYHDFSKAAQNIAAGSTSTTGIYETSAATKVLLEQLKNENESDQQKDDSEANGKRIKNAVNQANDKMKHVRTGCEFSYNEEINRVSIKIYDKDTKEVIKEIPPEESLKMLEKVWEIAGLLVDEKR